MTLTFKHANIQGAEITLFVNQIFGTMFLTEHKCVGIIGPGNALAPVVGSLKEVTEKIEEAKRAYDLELKKEGETK